MITAVPSFGFAKSAVIARAKQPIAFSWNAPAYVSGRDKGQANHTCAKHEETDLNYPSDCTDVRVQIEILSVTKLLENSGRVPSWAAERSLFKIDRLQRTRVYEHKLFAVSRPS